MKKVYPVIFTETKDNILIEVPDFEILTQGNDLTNAIDMARDAMGLKGLSFEEGKKEIPCASKTVDISKGTFADEGRTFLSFVDIDFDAYK